jgi:hypothetical protein
MAKIVHPALGRGLVQGHVAKQMKALGLKLGSQPKDPDIKEKVIERAAKTLGDADFDRARQVTNYLLNPKHAKGRSLDEMIDRLKTSKAKAPAKKAAKKAPKKAAKKASTRAAPAATEERTAAA